MNLIKIIIGLALVVMSITFASGTWYEESDIGYSTNTSYQNRITSTGVIYGNIMHGWVTCDDITDGLLTIGERSCPDVFEMDGTWYMITGRTEGNFTGYNWTGTTWQNDTDIISGLYINESYSSPTVFNMSGTWYLISGASGTTTGNFTGYNWTGTTWQNDTEIINGTEIHPDKYLTPEVFYMDSTWYMIFGNYTGNATGLKWNGSAWESDVSITSGLINYGTSAAFTIFEKNNNWYVIQGRHGGDSYGYYWNGSGWESNETVAHGLTDIGRYRVSHTVFEMNGIWYVLTGYNDGTYYGWDGDFNTHGIYWTGSAISNDVLMTVKTFNLSELTLATFNIDSNNLDWLTVTNLTNGEYYALYKDITMIEIGVATTEVTFQTNLGTDSYSVVKKEYVNQTGCHGFCKSGTPESPSPVAGITVYIFNSTWSDTTITDTSGYYVFLNLTNSTYTLNFRKDRYEPIDSQYVTPGTDEMYRYDIWIQKSTGEYYSRHYCTFTLKNFFGTRYSNVGAVVYENGDAQLTGTTGYDGSVVFHLFEDSEYTVAFINTTQNINKEITLYPRDNEYTVYITDFSFNPETAEMRDYVNWWYIKGDHNLSHGWLNFSYKDIENKTSFIEFWINDTDNSNLYYTNQTYPCTSGAIYESNNLINSSNHTYLVHFSATHPDYPCLANSGLETISYYTGKLIDLLFSEQWQYTVTSMAFLVFIACFFGATNVSAGGIIICLAAWLFNFIGWLPVSLVGYGALVLATLLSVGYAMRKNEVLHG